MSGDQRAAIIRAALVDAPLPVEADARVALDSLLAEVVNLKERLGYPRFAVGDSGRRTRSARPSGSGEGELDHGRLATRAASEPSPAFADLAQDWFDALFAIQGLPSQCDLLTNALARSMYEIASRTITKSIRDRA